MMLAHHVAPNAPGAGRRGHTLVELLIVIVLISIVASIAFPRVNYVGMRLDANTRVVRGVLQQAWRMSVQKQHDIIVSFDTTTNRMRIQEDVNNDKVTQGTERVTWRSLEEGASFKGPVVTVSGIPPKAVTGGGVVVIGTLPSIVFHRNGSTSGDVEIYLSAQNRSVTERRAVLLAQATGRTDWYRYVSGAWLSGGM
jgi:prepilin-type N-terminal cleavage/methylation domain-containing protein